MTQITGFTTDSAKALPLHVMEREQFAAWRAQQSPALVAWLDAQHFNGSGGSVVLEWALST